jgi:hypothetical protein
MGVTVGEGVGMLSSIEIGGRPKKDVDSVGEYDG